MPAFLPSHISSTWVLFDRTCGQLRTQVFKHRWPPQDGCKQQDSLWADLPSAGHASTLLQVRNTQCMLICADVWLERQGIWLLVLWLTHQLQRQQVWNPEGTAEFICNTYITHNIVWKRRQGKFMGHPSHHHSLFTYILTLLQDLVLC